MGSWAGLCGRVQVGRGNCELEIRQQSVGEFVQSQHGVQPEQISREMVN